MRASHSTTRLHTTEKLPVLLRATLVLAASALALCVAAGCSGSTDTFHTCANCKSSYNGGHVNLASCGHWFCDLKSNCKEQRDAHEALAKGTPSLDCGAELHYRCDGTDHSTGACGESGHFGCDGVNHDPASCSIAGHHLCDDGLHVEGNCGISGHWACDGTDHAGAPCGANGHRTCDGLSHTVASCNVEGHFACDGAKHDKEACSSNSEESPAAPTATNANIRNTHSHFGGAATCLTRATCEDCGQPYGSADPANHDAACSFSEAASCAHEVHDEVCGYAEAVEAAACTHECTTESGCVKWAYAPGSACTHQHTDECINSVQGHDANACNCKYSCEEGHFKSDANGSWWDPCDCGCWTNVACSHAHDATCGYSPGYSYSHTSCTHVEHDAACGFAEAAEAVPCKHAQDSHDDACGYAPGVPCSAA